MPEPAPCPHNSFPASQQQFRLCGRKSVVQTPRHRTCAAPAPRPQLAKGRPRSEVEVDFGIDPGSTRLFVMIGVTSGPTPCHGFSRRSRVATVVRVIVGAEQRSDEEAMMTRSVVERHSDESLEARRAEIVAQLGGDEDRIRERAAQYQLTVAEDALFDELSAIDFLLWRE